jgi:hypothetical protein
MLSAFLFYRTLNGEEQKLLHLTLGGGRTNVSVKLNQFNGLRQILCLLNAKFVNSLL